MDARMNYFSQNFLMHNFFLSALIILSFTHVPKSSRPTSVQERNKQTMIIFPLVPVPMPKGKIPTTKIVMCIAYLHGDDEDGSTFIQTM